jgi:hypothetical protein
MLLARTTRKRRIGRTRNAVAITAAGLAATIAMGGCSTSESTFANRSDAACTKAAHTIDRLAVTGDTSTGSIQAALRTAIDRYATIERLVSEITEGSKPGGSAGAAVESKWLDPARKSLTVRRSDLNALSKAVHDNDATAVPALETAAILAGTDGVDSAYLRKHGLTACADLFSAP